MKNVLKMAALMLCAAAMMTACNNNSSNNSTENKMAQFEKKAIEFKTTLDPSNRIIAERMDTVVQKVFYLDPNQDADGVNPIKNVLMHDFATDKTQALLPDEEKLNDYLLYGELTDNEESESFNHCYNMDYRNSELFGDRLFMMIHTECSFEMETSFLFYVNVLDNSLHFVDVCDDVKYDKAKGTIDIHNDLLKAAGEDLPYDFTISASSTDEEYAAMRNKNEEIVNKMVEKWREENLD